MSKRNYVLGAPVHYDYLKQTIFCSCGDCAACATCIKSCLTNSILLEYHEKGRNNDTGDYNFHVVFCNESCMNVWILNKCIQ